MDHAVRIRTQRRLDDHGARLSAIELERRLKFDLLHGFDAVAGRQSQRRSAESCRRMGRSSMSWRTRAHAASVRRIVVSPRSYAGWVAALLKRVWVRVETNRGRRWL